MAGSSNTNMSTWEPFSGIIPSAWGDDMVVTIDDKLHMTETSNTQTVQGPMVLSNTSVTTFAGPFNNTNTSVNTFAGSIEASGATVALWAADNPEMTRVKFIGWADILIIPNWTTKSHDWEYETSVTGCRSNVSDSSAYMGVHLPQGSELVALRAYVSGWTTGAVVSVNLYAGSNTGIASTQILNISASSSTWTLEEDDTPITTDDIHIVDNDTKNYRLRLRHSSTTAYGYIRYVEIEYKQIRPYE